MKRAQYLVQYNLKQRVTRTFSHSSVPPKKHIARKLDTTGRTFPFARRAVSTQRSRPPSQPNAGGPTREPPPDKVANALQAASSENTNQLLAPVHIPEDRHGILRTDHPATSILANSSIVVQRQLEMMNVLMGFEQANKYVLMDSTGNHIGFLVEQDHGIGKAVARQMFSTHRSFTTHVFDKNEREILRFHRPFSWISSSIKVYDAVHPEHSLYATSDALQGTGAGSITNETSAEITSLPLSKMRVIGEAQQQWAPLRRKYNLFLHRPLSETTSDAPQLTSGDLPRSNFTALQTTSPDEETHGFTQFASVDEPWLSWDFSLMSGEKKLIGSVNRNFAGFAREIFTDTGVYALRMDSAGLAAEPGHLVSKTGAQAQGEQVLENPTGMTLDQRAVMLATAVSIDFDYFSRHSGTGGGVGWMPLWFPWGGGAAGEAGAVGGAAEASGAAGAEGGLAGRGAGEVARDIGVGEGAAAGAGGLAGYEAIQRAREASQQPDDASPAAPDQQSGNDDDFWGGFRGPGNSVGGSGSSGNSPGGRGSGENGGAIGGDDGGGADGGGDGIDFSDFF